MHRKHKRSEIRGNILGSTSKTKGSTAMHRFITKEVSICKQTGLHEDSTSKYQLWNLGTGFKASSPCGGKRRTWCNYEFSS
jgi:hypothetical protein